MTKKDYKLIAEAIKQATDPIIADDNPVAVKAKIISALSSALIRDNARFDHVKFETACYPD